MREISLGASEQQQLLKTFQEKEKTPEEVAAEEERRMKAEMENLKKKEKMPKVVDGQRCNSIGILLKKNNIDVDALISFITLGGPSDDASVPVDLIEQISALITPPKKEPTKFDAEREGLLSYDNDSSPLIPPEVFLKRVSYHDVALYLLIMVSFIQFLELIRSLVVSYLGFSFHSKNKLAKRYVNNQTILTLS
jgi:hypothetical protein